MTLSEAFSLFECDYIREKGLSTATEDNYRQALASILKVVPDRQIEFFSNEDFLKWSRYLRKRGLVAGTRRGYKSKVKNVLVYTNRRGLTDFDTSTIELEKLPRSLPEYLLPYEIEMLLQNAQCPRDEAIISTLFSAGVRTGELCALNRSDIRGGVIKITKGKGSKDREVPLNDKLAARLQAYLNARTDKDRAMFVGLQGRLQTSRVQKIVMLAARRAGLEQRISPRVLRHSFATDLHSNGADIRHVQYFMGHEFLATTEIYTHIVTAKSQAIFRQCQTTV